MVHISLNQFVVERVINVPLCCLVHYTAQRLFKSFLSNDFLKIIIVNPNPCSNNSAAISFQQSEETTRNHCSDQALIFMTYFLLWLNLENG